MKTNLDTIITDISLSIKSAQQALEHSDIKWFMNSFIENEKGNLEAETKTILIPYNDKKSVISVPTAVLFIHNSLQLSQVNVKLKVALESTAEGLKADLVPSEEAGTREMSEIELTFKTDNVADGTSIVKERMLANI